MGRWSQRRIGGGGGAAAVSLVRMASCSPDTATNVTVIYDGAVNAAAFTPANFTTTPSNLIGTLVTQAAAEALTITFPPDVSGETTIDYTGTTPGVLSPDSCTL